MRKPCQLPGWTYATYWRTVPCRSRPLHNPEAEKCKMGVEPRTNLYSIGGDPLTQLILFKIDCPKIPLCVICVHSYTNILRILYSYTTPSKFGEKNRHLCILDEGIIRHLPRKCFIYMATLPSVARHVIHADNLRPRH